ncbi:DUF3379 family protein [Alteromonas sp. ASW11-130]|uniref:DUF3379 family protein n=1 Tax=Alteromonas sp. ASW11-130 TaxID=3015775 RepID=UPI002242409D|nr:DUF3379 family protein [Alteromonas sp. ASW11-130]MCW8093055.1 DUF3379 domain-containing protein [Alteromonas sp. ASW11-130]
MDELEFRRRIYADPNTTDEAVIAAAKTDTKKQAFWNEVKSFNQKLEKATDIAVPEDLAHRLIWQQGIKQFQQKKQRSRRLLAVAASVAIMIGVSFTLWNQWLNADLQNQLLTHASYADQEEAHADAPADLTNVNAKLAGYGAQFENNMGEVKVANHCYLGAAKTLHLILKTAQGTLSVFVFPEHESRYIPKQFANEHVKGSLLTMNDRSVVVMGERDADLTAWESKLKKTLTFSI